MILFGFNSSPVPVLVHKFVSGSQPQEPQEPVAQKSISSTPVLSALFFDPRHFLTPPKPMVRPRLANMASVELKLQGQSKGFTKGLARSGFFENVAVVGEIHV